jgi:ribosomal-protein-alanine N-acetyltransferase
MRVLAGDGVTLEPQIAAHAAALYAVISEPALYRYIDSKEPESEAALAERLARLESRVSPDGTEHWLNWVVRTASGEIVGYVQATVTPDHQAEIAYVFGLAHQRRGYAFAACAAMIAELGASYGVTQLTATLDPQNAASRALLEKLGFTLAGEDPTAHEVTFARDL